MIFYNLPPTFSQLSGTTLPTVKPTIIMIYSQQVTMIVALSDETDIFYLFITIDKKIFTFTPIIGLTEGIHTIRLTVLDKKEKTLP